MRVLPLLGAVAVGCGARTGLDLGEPGGSVASPPVTGGAPAAGGTGGRAPTQPPEGSCTDLPSPRLVAGGGHLEVSYACGMHSATVQEYSDFRAAGVPCTTGSNTFAIRVTGADRERYSAVARCGYIRYDNGTFVGSRVAVEARDGQWCHELALEQIELVDRMLLTDVSFAIEATDPSAPAQRLALQVTTRFGSTGLLPAETNLCAYVAHRQYGGFVCSMAPPTPDCVCPCDPAWFDFFNSITISLARP